VSDLVRAKRLHTPILQELAVFKAGKIKKMRLLHEDPLVGKIALRYRKYRKKVNYQTVFPVETVG
jgi:hypothetical protein